MTESFNYSGKVPIKEFKKRNVLSSLFLIVHFFSFIILTSAISYSQSYQLFRYERENIIKNAKWKIGPFRIYPAIRFRNIGYDDNIYRKKEEDEPTSDYTATFSPKINIYLLFHNWMILSFSENPEYVYFVKEKRERSFNNIYMPGLKLLIFNRFVLSGNYQYRKARRRASSEFDVRADEKIEAYNSSFFYETGRGTSFGFSGTITKISYEDISLPGEEIYLSRLLNREERSGSFEFYYRIFSESFFFVSGGYTEYYFENIESRWKNSYSYHVYSGIRFPILGRVRGILSLGYKKLMPHIARKNGFSGLVGNTSLDLRVRRFGFHLRYSRDSYFSFWTDSIFFLEDRYGAGISFYLFRFLRLDYDFTYGKSHYPEPILIRLPDESYAEIKGYNIMRIHTAGFVFRIIRNTGIGLRINYWERDSNVRGWGGRKSWFIGGYITQEF